MTGVLLTDATVLTMDGARTAYERGWVWWEGALIRGVGPASRPPDLPPGTAVISLPGHVVMPGLVNAHAHASNNVMRGVFDELPLEAWIEGLMWKTLRQMDGEAAEAGATLALWELMRQGVTTTANSEFSWPHLDWSDGTLTAIRRSGVRCLYSRMTKDSPDPASPAFFVPEDARETPALAIAEVERLRRAFTSPLVEICPEPVGPLWCTEEMVRALHGWAVANGTPLLMHMNDSQEERDEAQRRFGVGTVVQMERWGCLEAPQLYAHCTWLDDQEIRLLAEHGIGVAYDPVANASYACGLARLPDLLAAGVPVGLGVDGASTNNSQNLWETAKAAILMQKNALGDAGFGSAELALELLTIGGARALHLDDRIGSLEPGKQADVIAIDLDRPSLAPRQTALSSLVYSFDTEALRHLWVAGEQRVRDGRHLLIDPAEAVESVNRQAERQLRASGLDRLVRERMAGRWSWQ